jgi:hypothetical protein
MTSTRTFFETNIIDPTIKVFSLSDIHGDIQSLIISLRDCAKVIRKKATNPFDNNIYDEDMETMLKMDLNTQVDSYNFDLNYEWIGENTHVVICGDMIDPFRSQSMHENCLKDGNLACSYYPQIELKILIFINSINSQAKTVGGRIIKLLGNHELLNIIEEPSLPYNTMYSYPEDRSLNDNYFLSTSRVNIFRVGNIGFNLLFEDGCGLLVKINNIIFVHGDLVDTYDLYNLTNQFINDPSQRSQKLWEDSELIKALCNDTSLFSRKRGISEDASIRIIEKNRGDTTLSEEFCSDLLESFKTFKGDGRVIKERFEDLKLVIGHCPQYLASTRAESNETYSTKIREDDVIEVFGQDIYSGEPIFDRTDHRRRIFGITMECLVPSTNLNRVYRIDVGSSRGIDIYPRDSSRNIMNIETLENENKYLYSKTPQILEINIDGSINIIKSKMRNTRIHLPRPIYEIHARSIPDLDIHTSPIQAHYLKKYLKYKNKYLQLKNLI